MVVAGSRWCSSTFVVILRRWFVLLFAGWAFILLSSAYGLGTNDSPRTATPPPPSKQAAVIISALSLRAYLPKNIYNHAVFQKSIVEQVKRRHHPRPNNLLVGEWTVQEDHGGGNDDYVEWICTVGGERTFMLERMIRDDPYFLHGLPASKITLGWTVAMPRGHEEEEDEEPPQLMPTMQEAYQIWKQIHNYRGTHNNMETSFSIGSSTRPLHRRSLHHRRARQQKTLEVLPEQRSEDLKWFLTAMRQTLGNLPNVHPTTHGGGEAADMKFQVVVVPSLPSASSKSRVVFQVDLELLVRRFSLLVGQQHHRPAAKGPTKLQRRRRRSKRLESFVLAKVADIQPGDVVLDPMCKRGTILIEAAKYWPLASAFIGMDSQLGNIQHALMNAQSTNTVLDLIYLETKGLHQPGPQKASLVRCLSQKQKAQGISSISKIITCLPFAKSVETYKDLLCTWIPLLDDSTSNTSSLTLAIDSASVNALTDALKAVNERMGQPKTGWCMIPVIVSMEWGNAQVTVVQLLPERAILMESPGLGLSKRESKLPRLFHREQWERLRRRQIPWLIPSAQCHHKSRLQSSKKSSSTYGR